MYTGNMPRVVTLLLLVVAFTVSGCATKKVYPGPELPREKVAIITHKFFNWGPNIRIAQVDGEQEGFFKGIKYYFAVKPGKHRVEVYLRSCIIIGGTSPITVCRDTPPSILSFEAEANHKYIVHGESFSNPKYWIEDEQTRQVVGRYPE